MEKAIGPQRKPSAAAKPTICDKSDAMHANRREAIDEMISKGVFAKVERGGIVDVWVAPRFYAASFESKKILMEVVYCYNYDATDDSQIIRLLDSQSGKEVGKYSTMFGLEME